MKYLTPILIVFLMILNVYLFTFCKCKQIKEKFSVDATFKDNTLINHFQDKQLHKKLLNTNVKEAFSMNNDQIIRMEQNAIQFLKDLQQLKYVKQNENEVVEENEIIEEEEYDDHNSESSEIEYHPEHENEIEGFVEMCTSNCSTI